MQDAILDRAETYYQYSKWQVREDFLSREHILEIIDFIYQKNGDKSPGAVLMREGYTSNQQAIDSIGREAIAYRVETRVEQLLSCDPNDPDSWIKVRYMADPVRVFTKYEPHTAKKVAQKRWRLIWGVSLIDQIIDRLLSTEVVQASIANSHRQCAKPGFSFSNGGVQKMVEFYDDGSDDWISFDASSFDFTVAWWQILLATRLDQRLMLPATSPKILCQQMRWMRLMSSRTEAALYGKFCFSDGRVCRKTKPGLQLSGRFITIDYNGKIMLMTRIHYDVSHNRKSLPRGIITMGDDSVQAGIAKQADEYVSFVKEVWGITLTVESEPGRFQQQNFCSMDFVRNREGIWVYVPRNVDKNFYALAYMEKKKRAFLGDTLVNLCLQYVYHPTVFPQLHQTLALRFPEKCRSRRWFESKMTGYESSWFGFSSLY